MTQIWMLCFQVLPCRWLSSHPPGSVPPKALRTVRKWVRYQATEEQVIAKVSNNPYSRAKPGIYAFWSPDMSLSRP